MRTTLLLASILSVGGCTGPTAESPAPTERAPAEPAPAEKAGGDEAAKPVGGEPVGAAPAHVSPDEAKKEYDAAIAAIAGKTPAKETVQVDGASVVLYHWEDPRLIVSEPCAPNGVLGSCQALDAVRDVPTKKVDVGPGNPASSYCPAAGGTEVNATGEGGESGLCRFADGSMVASWSLVYVPEFGRKAVSGG